jgi:hypothetical protein
MRKWDDNGQHRCSPPCMIIFALQAVVETYSQGRRKSKTRQKLMATRRCGVCVSNDVGR